MPEYDRIDISEGININKTNASKECKICRYHNMSEENKQRITVRLKKSQSNN